MSLASAWAVALHGVDGMLVEIEADIGPGLPGLHMVGLPDTALSEARDRVRAAVLNSGERWPSRRMTLALSPATLPKGGSSYDLALACALLAADRRIPGERLCGLVLIGELALDGRLRPVRGVLPAVLAARQVGIGQVVVPTASLAEASLVDGIRVRGATCLKEVLSWLRNPTVGLTCPGPPRPARSAAVPDLRDVLSTRRRSLGGGGRRCRGSPSVPHRAAGHGQDHVGAADGGAAAGADRSGERSR